MPKIIDYKNLTDDQKNAVDQDGEVLVSAAAGSGKTTALLAKIKRLIESGMPLSKMLILVYNESAAAEIKQKLATELFNCACEYNDEKGDLYRRQLDEIMFAHVGTIHSFCRTAIRENFEKLSLSPSFEVLDENAHDLYMKRALEDVFVEYTNAKDELFFKLCSVFESNRNEDEIKEIIKKIFEQFDVQPDKQDYADKVLSSYADANDNPYKNTVIDALKNRISRIKYNLTFIKHDIDMSDEHGYINLADEIFNFVTACEKVDGEALVKKLMDGCEFAKPRAKDNSQYKDVIDAVKGLKKAVGDVIEQAQTLFGDEGELEKEFEQNKLFAEKLIEVTMKFSEKLDALKKADDVLSFADLEHGVVNLINQGVDLSEDYDYVFVDEYQDVNLTQEVIIKHLLKENSFFVGDIKQSIYGFRLADPDIFLKRLKDRKEKAQNGDGIAPISFVDNFRSENQILEFVNEIFDKVMTKDSADVDYHNDARFNKTDRMDGSVKMALIFAPSKKKDNIDSGIYKIDEAEQEEQEDGKNEYEGKYIAREIKSLVGKGTFGDRKLTYGDFAILFRKRTDSNSKILATLKSEGIPVDDGAFSKDNDDSENELMMFLKVIDNPRQDFAFTGFLLSYFGGYDENELYEIAKCKPKTASKDEKENFYSAFLIKSQDDDALGLKCRKTLEKLNEYGVKASFKSVSSLVSTIIAENDYDAYLRSKGDAVLNSVESFVASISTDENNIGLNQFLSEYGTNKKLDKKSVGGDRVQVSTFHAYKGLEVPVVFIANAAGDRDARSGQKDWFILDNGMLGLSYFDEESKMKNKNTLSMTALKYAIKMKEYKEEMRLAYVALTRAQKMLYITGKSSCTSEKPNKEDYFSTYNELKLDEGKSIYDFIFSAKVRGANIANPEVYLPSDFEENADEKKLVLSLTESEITRLIKDSWHYAYPYSEATTLPIKYSVSTLASNDADENDAIRVYDDKAVEGTIYHKFMENIDFDICDLGDVENRKNQLVTDGVMTREEADIIDDMKIIKALQTPELKMAATHEHECEKPFMMYVPANEVNPDTTATDKVLVQGVIDLWIKGDKEKGEGDVIVDYKYSALKDEKSLKNYEKQLKLYKKAIQKAFSVKIDEICLISLKTGEVKKFD